MHIFEMHVITWVVAVSGPLDDSPVPPSEMFVRLINLIFEFLVDPDEISLREALIPNLSLGHSFHIPLPIYIKHPSLTINS